MKLLLDTHVFLWLNSAPELLSESARQACDNPNNSLYLSFASIWEIQIKQQLGKLRTRGLDFCILQKSRPDPLPRTTFDFG